MGMGMGMGMHDLLFRFRGWERADGLNSPGTFVIEMEYL